MRNYIELYMSIDSQSHAWIGRSAEETVAIANAYKALGNPVTLGVVQKVYLLLDRDLIWSMLSASNSFYVSSTLLNHKYTAWKIALGTNVKFAGEVFSQDQILRLESPRKSWSHGH